MWNSRLAAGLALTLWCGATQVAAETVQVNPDNLGTAIEAAEAGTVLLLEGGDYGALALRDVGGAQGNPLVLKAADPANPPRFAAMELREVSHMVLDGLVFDYKFRSGDSSFLRPFQVIGAKDLTISGALFDGDIGAENAPTGFGLSVKASQGVTLQESEIRFFYNGLSISQSRDVILRDNELHSMRMDGMKLAAIENILIEGNYIHDFDRVVESEDHADMIQFWTNGTRSPSKDIIIRNNILNSGHGAYTQSIFMRNDLVDRGLAGKEMYYRNVLIEENVIINAHLHGITLGETDGLTIRKNSIIRNAASEGKKDNPMLWTPQIRVAKTSINVEINRNIVFRVVGYEYQPDWLVEKNFPIQDRSPSESGFYDKVFRAARSGDPSDLANFFYLPGGPLDGAGLGASRLAGG